MAEDKSGKKIIAQNREARHEYFVIEALETGIELVGTEVKSLRSGGANLKGVKLDEKAMAHTEAIILSMTPKEREKPEIIGASRKKRIAAGAGVRVEDVNKLLKSFEQMRKLIKQFSGPGAGKKMKRMSRMGGFGGGFPGF